MQIIYTPPSPRAAGLPTTERHLRRLALIFRTPNPRLTASRPAALEIDALLSSALCQAPFFFESEATRRALLCPPRYCITSDLDDDWSEAPNLHSSVVYGEVRVCRR
jgi:hypothetical protein